jgi:hypothetical protein
MSNKPVVPDDAEPDEAPEHEEKESEALAAAREMAAARKRWAPTRKQLGISAAVGIGSAAIVAALLYASKVKKPRSGGPKT